MSVTLHAEGADYRDAMRLLGRGLRDPDISIRYRDGADFGREPLPGCIVRIGGDIEREFKGYAQAVAFIGEYLRLRDEDALTPPDKRVMPEKEFSFLELYERVKK